MDSATETTVAVAAEVQPATNGTAPAENNNGNNGNCYDDLFPALLGDGAPKPANGGSWGMGMPQAKALPALRAINKTEFFTIAFEERRHKDPPASVKFGGSVDCDQPSEREKKLVKDIGNQTSTSIELTTSKTDGGLTVVINGKVNSVTEAKSKIIQQLVRDAQAELVIPKDHHRHILGAKALRLRTLEQETGTKVFIPKHDDDSELVVIKGPKDGIALAAHKIQTLSDELAKNDREVMEVEKKFHVFILGPNNKTIEGIRTQTGAKVRVPPLSSKEDQTIVITGEKEAVSEAKRQIAQIYTNCKNNIKDTSMQVPKEQHKYILGRGGQTLQDMFEKTGVWIEVPPQESDSQTIKLLGEPGKLGQALSLVYEKANSVIKVEMAAPSWLHKYLIGKKGENINRVRENFKDAYVEFADQSIRIEGPRESVNAVSQLLQSEMDEITAKTKCLEVRCPAAFHPHIIGKSGSNVNRLKTELNVKIHIPAADDENADVITIEGEPDDVARASKELEELVNKLRNETVKELKCESRLHGQIIGQGGEKITEIRKKFNQVSITVPQASKHIDVITIRGDRQDVEKCHAHLTGIVKELQRTQFKVDVTLFKQFVRYLQGPKGRQILSSIQQETGAKVQLPKESSTASGGEQVAVIGEKDKAEKAKQLLLDAQRKNSDVVETTVNIPNKLHGPLLRHKRALLNSVLQEANCGAGEVDVVFPPSESQSDRCVLSGPKAAVDRARARLLEECNERALASYTEELKAKPAHHRFLIGRQGAKIRKLREKTSARVVFPAEDSEDRETILIIGREQAVKAARAELEAAIRELENEIEDKVNIPVKYHKMFIARRAELVNQISDEFGGVQVSFPKSGSQSEEVTLKGAAECVAAAKQRLLEKSAEFENQVTIACVIPQVHHRALMGAKGVRVQAITKEFGVQIKFPEKAGASRRGGGDEAEVEEEPVADTPEAIAARNTINISGARDKCEGAKAALEALVPVEVEVPVSASLHRFIIGQRGRDVRELMDKYEVGIKVPQADDGVDFVRVTGPADNVARCRVELEERIRKLEGEAEDRKLKSFSLTVDVPAKHHPKIVGRKGAVVSKLREKHQVQIQFPNKGEDETNDTITVTGYEENAYAARDEILRMVQELEDMVSRFLKIDHRIHSRIIGQRGRNVRKIMEDFKVEIKFPRDGAADPDLVEVIGLEDNVEEAINHLKDQEDELMGFASEEMEYQRPQEPTLKSIFQAPTGAPAPRQGFVVKGAPWNQPIPDSASQSDFPSFGDRGGPNGMGAAWGPRR